MWSVLVTAWRVIARRAIADRVILSAAAITIVLGTVLLAAGPIYADAVTLSAARRTLNDAPVTAANAEITARVTTESFNTINDLVDVEIARAFALTGGTSYRRGTSESYALPVQPTDEVTNLIVFRFFDQFTSHTTLVEGSWPEAGDEPYQVAVPRPAAELLEIEVGDELQVTNRRDESHQPTVRVVGIYQVDDPSEPYWYEETLDIDGIDVGQSFTTYGPFVAAPETLIGPLTPFSAEVDWRVFPDFDNLTVGELGGMRSRLAQLEGRLNTGRDAGARIRVETGLIEILRETERSLLVTRSGVLILTVQLAILAGYALLLTAGLLSQSRTVETKLLRSRGAGNRQILSMALMEGLILTVPAVIAGPWLAALALRVLNSLGPLADIDLAINPVVNQASYILAILAALGCLAALAYPAYRSAREFGNPRAALGRQADRSLAQRAGIDLALLAIAVIAFWQLRRFGAPITENVQGRLGIDPLLVAAPALGLLAGAIVALRSIPLLAQIAERVSANGNRAVPALSAWQVARRPLQYARSALLLMLAVGIGLFAVSYATTWRESQRDQAAYQTGADIRVSPDRRFGTAIPDLMLHDVYLDVEGYVDSMPVVREFGQIARTSGTSRFVMLDAARASEIVQLRSDLAAEPLPVLMERLASERYLPPAIPLPGEPRRIALDVRMTVEPLPEDFEPPPDVRPSRLELTPRGRVILLDAKGQLHRIELGEFEPDGDPSRLASELIFDLGDGTVAEPSYPLSLVSVEIYSGAPQEVVRTGALAIDAVLVSGDREGDGWQMVEAGLAPDTWEATVTDIALAVERGFFTYQDEQPERGARFFYASGATSSDVGVPVTFSLRMTGPEPPAALPVLVSEDFLELGGLEIGDTIPLSTLPRFDGDGRIVGTVREFPTVAPETGEPVILDYQTFAAMSLEPGQITPVPDEYWFQIEQGQIEDAVTQLEEEPFSSRRVASVEAREEALQSDPVAVGMIGALTLGFVAAGIFAALGFVSSAAVSARERLVEFALLRAVGLSSRQLVGWLTLEHGLLVIFGLIGGSVLGLLLSWLTLPLIAITQEATRAVPQVIVVYPWSTIVWLEAGMVLVLLVAVGLLGLMLRRMGLGSLLRLGEE